MVVANHTAVASVLHIIIRMVVVVSQRTQIPTFVADKTILITEGVSTPKIHSSRVKCSKATIASKDIRTRQRADTPSVTLILRVCVVQLLFLVLILFG